jgi:hypothetical protein
MRYSALTDVTIVRDGDEKRSIELNVILGPTKKGILGSK